MAGACGGHFGCKWLREGLAHPPVPWSMPRARCPLSGLKLESCQFEIFVREERSRTSRLLRLQLCANLHSHFVTSPTMPNHVCCSTTRQTRGDQASACSRHKSKKPKSRVCSPLRFCSSIIGLVFSLDFRLSHVLLPERRCLLEQEQTFAPREGIGAG